MPPKRNGEHSPENIRKSARLEKHHHQQKNAPSLEKNTLHVLERPQTPERRFISLVKDAVRGISLFEQSSITEASSSLPSKRVFGSDEIGVLVSEHELTTDSNTSKTSAQSSDSAVKEPHDANQILSQRMPLVPLRQPLGWMFQAREGTKTPFEITVNKLKVLEEEYEEVLKAEYNGQISQDLQEITQVHEKLEKIPGLLKKRKTKEARELFQEVQHQEKNTENQELRTICEDLRSIALTIEKVAVFHQQVGSKTRIKVVMNLLQEKQQAYLNLLNKDPYNEEAIHDLNILTNIYNKFRKVTEAYKDGDSNQILSRYNELQQGVNLSSCPVIIRTYWQYAHNMPKIIKELDNKGWDFVRLNPDYDFPQEMELRPWRNDAQLPTHKELIKLYYSMVAGSIILPHTVDAINRKLNTIDKELNEVKEALKKADPNEKEQLKWDKQLLEETKPVLQTTKSWLETGQWLPGQFPKDNNNQPKYKRIELYLPTLVNKCENQGAVLVRRDITGEDPQTHKPLPGERGIIFVASEPSSLTQICKNDDIRIDRANLSKLMTNRINEDVYGYKGTEKKIQYEIICSEEELQENLEKKEPIRYIVDYRLRNEPKIIIFGFGPEDNKSICVSDSISIASTDKTGNEGTMRNIKSKFASLTKQKEYPLYLHEELET